MRTSFENGVRAVQVFHPMPNALYSLEMAANMAHIPRRTILLYCKHHLVSPVENSPLAGFYFDNEAIRQLQRIEELRERFGCNMAGLKFMLKLMNEVERLQFEQRFFAA